MDPNQLDCINEPDFLCISGSRLYGTERYNDQGECVSDLDLRGFGLPPFDYLLGIVNDFEERAGKGEDHKVYSLKRFIELLMKGNAQCLECLYAPPSHVQRITDVGRRILDNRNLFASKVYFKAITGFAYSEWNAVRGQKYDADKRTNDQNQFLKTIPNVFPQITRESLAQAKEALLSGHKKVLVDAKADVGEKRRKEYERYGYGASSASHALRLLYQCRELLDTGVITFPRPEAVILSKVKRGEMALQDIELLYEAARVGVEEAAARSELPEKPDAKKVWSLYREIVRDYVRTVV